MARKPSFDFERRERAKGKALKRSEKAKAKADKKSLVESSDAPEVSPAEKATGDIELSS